MQGTYDRLRVHTFASWRDVVRAANGRIAKKHRRAPAMRKARKRFYYEMFDCHQRHQDLVRTFRL
ncbi:MAG: hypothetical protein J0H42_35040 [Rhizobiales bacterium]|nr:hypothetical protein [Hyphomicrobiales bacterium]